MKKHPKPGTLIWARWKDHCCYTGWVSIHRTEPRMPTMCEIVGWVLKADKESWELTPARAYDDEGEVSSVDNVHVLISSQVTEWSEIKG